MQVSNIHQAKTNLSALIQDALNGKEVVIAKAGKPVVKLVPFNQEINARQPGKFSSKISISDDFSDEDNQVIHLFEGNVLQ